MATGNEYRKVRALLAKTMQAGCTEGEAVSALETALKLIGQYGLDEAKLTITVPEGYVRGEGNTLVKVAPQAEAKPACRLRQSKPKGDAPKQPKGPTKKQQVIDWLSRPEGLTIAQLMEAHHTLKHSARATISIIGREIGGVVYDKETKVYRVKAAS